VGWPGEDGVTYEVWSGTSNASESAGKWAGSITVSGSVAGTVITGLANNVDCYVWIKSVTGGAPSGFSEGTTGRPEAAITTAGADFVYVPGGSVTGSVGYAVTLTVPDDPAYNDPGSSSVQKGVFVEGRTVSFDSFIMAKYETTRQLWYDVQVWALSNGYNFQNPMNSAPTSANEKKPVTGISWRDTIVWCNAYSEKEGKAPVYRAGGAVLRDSRNANGAACDGAVMDKTKSGFRLPTEVEREFAARGGDPGEEAWMYTYAGSDDVDDVAWYNKNASGQLKEVGQKTANRLGVYDLSGNVQEWGWDWMNWAVSVTADTPEDGVSHNALVGSRNGGNQKPFNGGGVGSNPTMSSVAYRWGYPPEYKDGVVGFRVVRKVAPGAE
jgi:formylglycine-generating enzyme required for sulfatase activity